MADAAETKPVGPADQDSLSIAARSLATLGSHHQYKHKSKPGRVTIAGKPSDVPAPGTLNSILKQAGLKET